MTNHATHITFKHDMQHDSNYTRQQGKEEEAYLTTESMVTPWV